MEELIKQAMKALQENVSVNEITLTDGDKSVRVLRVSAIIYQWQSWPYQYYPQPGNP